MKVWLARCTVVKAIPFKLLNFVFTYRNILCYSRANIIIPRTQKECCISFFWVGNTRFVWSLIQFCMDGANKLFKCVLACPSR